MDPAKTEGGLWPADDPLAERFNIAGFSRITVPVAYVLINTEVGAEKEVLEKLKEIPEVVEAHIVFGIYDVIAKVSVDRQELLGEVVTNKLRRLGKVRYTLTIIAVEGFEKCSSNCT